MSPVTMSLWQPLGHALTQAAAQAGQGTVNLSHTPGFYYALAYWLSTVFYIRMNAKRLNGIWRGLLEAGFLVALEAFMIVTDGIDIRFYFPCSQNVSFNLAYYSLNPNHDSILHYLLL